MNKRLREKNEARTYINNIDEAILKYDHAFAKPIKPLSTDPELSDFYHPPENQKNDDYYLLQWVQALQHICPIQVP